MTTFAPRVLRTRFFSSPSPSIARAVPHQRPTPRLTTPATICVGLFSAAGLHTYQRNALLSKARCDSPAGAAGFASGNGRKTGSGLGDRLNEKSLREVSSGSLLGLGAGVLVAFFSKPLALLIGLTIAGLQFLEYNGIHLVPYGYLQRYFKSIDLQKAVRSNVAFKLAFGVTFALAGFGSFGA